MYKAQSDFIMGKIESLVAEKDKRISELESHSGKCVDCGAWTCGFCGLHNSKGEWRCNKCHGMTDPGDARIAEHEAENKRLCKQCEDLAKAALNNGQEVLRLEAEVARWKLTAKFEAQAMEDEKAEVSRLRAICREVEELPINYRARWPNHSNSFYVSGLDEAAAIARKARP
jgi:hypothetical protein